MATNKITLNELKTLIKQIINEGLPIGKSQVAQDAANKLNLIVSKISRPNLENQARYHASEIIKLIDEDQDQNI